jgi:RNA polymerase sigma-70 factor (ECF subfamily)
VIDFMGNAVLTRPSLIARLGDPADRAAWQEFVELYGSLVYGFARQRGFQDADAADLTQDVFLTVARSAGRWRFDRRRGSFRNWLYGITRHRIAKFRERRRSQPVGDGGTDAVLRLAEEPAPAPDEAAAWQDEFQRRLFRLAADQVRDSCAPATWEAFRLTAVEGRSGADVAAEVGLSVGAVYVARSRVLARITERIRRLEAEWSDS